MTDFLLELRSEEIPARMQARAREDLAKLFAAELARAGLAASETLTYATPRRLALIARGLPLETATVHEERRGPRVGAPEQALEGFLRSAGVARDKLHQINDGKATFYYAIVEKPGRATADVLAEAIPAIVRAFPWPKSMRWGDASASTESLRWVRPLHGIVALFGEDVVPCEIAGVTSGSATLGHRFHHPGQITIGSASDYVEKLRACHVLVDQTEREALIRARATALAAEAGLELIADEGLVAENAGLTEWPVPLLGRFDEAFLSVPPEVIQLTARVNQKYFVCRSADGKLANAFICTANIAATDGGARIVEGNRKVLAARLSDARFFYETDLKLKLEEQAKKLDRIVFHEKLGTVADKVDRVAKLARWLVEEGIVKSSPLAGRGTGEAGGGGAPRSASPADSPLHHASGEFGDELPPAIQTRAGGTSDPKLPLPASGEELATLAERAARLAKADLVTGMVGEFPELQGVMGGYYAAAQNEHPAVAAAIRDHYKPVGQGDDVPTDPVTVAVSLADKLDTIAAFFAIDEKPTGSKDPFALRRAALGVIALLQTNRVALRILRPFSATYLPARIFSRLDNFEIPHAEMAVEQEWIGAPFDFARRLRRAALQASEGASEEDAELYAIAAEAQHDDRIKEYDRYKDEFLSFFADRLKVQQREAGVRHDLIDAVFALGGEDDLVRLLARVHALQAFVGTADGANLLAGYKRAANILKKEGYEALRAPAQEHGGAGKTLSYTPEIAETALIAALDAAEPAAARAVAAEDFEAAMAALATLRAPIDAFFESVTVNDPDAAKRDARLALLERIRAAVHTVADFSKITD